MDSAWSITFIIIAGLAIAGIWWDHRTSGDDEDDW